MDSNTRAQPVTTALVPVCLLVLLVPQELTILTLVELLKDPVCLVLKDTIARVEAAQSLVTVLLVIIAVVVHPHQLKVFVLLENIVV